MDITRLRELAGMPLREDAGSLYLAVDWDGDMAWLTPSPHGIGELIGYDDEAVYDIGACFSIDDKFGEFIGNADEEGRFKTSDVSHGGGYGGIAFGVLELSPEEAQFFQDNGAVITTAEEVAAGAAMLDDEDDDEDDVEWYVEDEYDESAQVTEDEVEISTETIVDAINELDFMIQKHGAAIGLDEKVVYEFHNVLNNMSEEIEDATRY